MSVWEKVKEFFAEDESWRQKEPIEYEGKLYGAWVEEKDEWKAWPNAPCAKCKGIMLKKEMYWNQETDTWYHKECLEALKAAAPAAAPAPQG